MQILITANCDIRTKIDFEICRFERSIEVRTLPEGGVDAKLQILDIKDLLVQEPPMKELYKETVYNVTVFDKSTDEVFFSQDMKCYKSEIIPAKKGAADGIKIYWFKE